MVNKKVKYGMFLITEQNETLREIYGRLLSCAGYEVVVKKTIKEAVAFIEKELYNVEFLMFGLKDPQDPERLLVRKTREKFRDCKIFLIVDEMTEEVRNFIAEHNVDVCLSKPFLPSDLLKRISLLHPSTRI